MPRFASCVRSSSSLRSTSLAGLLVAALALWGCGGGGGGGETGGNGGAGGAAKGGTSGGGATGKGGAAGGTVTGKGGAAGGTATGAGGAAGGTVTGTGGAAGGTVTGTGGAAGGTVTGTGGAAGGTVTGTGGAAGSGTGGAAGSGVGGAAGSGAICTNGASCTTSGGVTGICSGGTCQGCSGSSACVTAYGTGYVCVTSSGNCVMGNCATNGDCSGKICGTNHTCGACTTPGDCTTAYGTGYICQTSNGTCIQGNCTSNSQCGTGQICSGNTCVSCGTSDSACTTSYGSGYICASGNCVMGTCHSGAQCSGQICDASHACAACTDDTGCQASYTDGRICDTTSGLCIVGNCHTNTNCSNGQVCVSNTCVNCTSNGQCSSGQVCLPSGACTAGDCVTAADCNDATKVCNANTCGACTASGDCTAAYGTNHVCNTNGQCVGGNCVTTADCATSGTLCGSVTPFTCGTCGSGTAGDNLCATAYGSGHICNGGVCVTGTCHDSTNCNPGQVCDLTTHTCGGCGNNGAAGDATCQGDTSRYGMGYICQGNACIHGNCHAAGDCNNTAEVCNSFTCGNCSTNADCTNAYGTNHVCNGSGQCISGTCANSGQCGGNQLCIGNACVACTAGATGDAQCVADTATYGPMHICLAGQCVAGNCHDTSSECINGQICGITATHTCGSCGTGTAGDNACKGDGYYSTLFTNDICLSGGCVQGDCHDTDGDCSTGKICGVSTVHTCGNCTTDTAGDTECQTHFGGGDICVQGLCGPGNCRSTSDCTGTNAGLICGVSIANTCGSCTSDSQCQSDSFYNPSDICNKTTGKCESSTCSPNNTVCADNHSDFCCNGGCVAGSCCVDTDCGAVGVACVNHTCSTCDAVSGNKWYVDPANGNDNTATGSDKSNGSVVAGCAFRTVNAAIAAMTVGGRTPFPGSQIIIVGQSGSTTGLAAGDNLPIIIPTNTTLTTTGGPITITLKTTAAGNPAGFQLNNNNSGITGGTGAALVLDGNGNLSGIGIQVSPGTSTFTTSVSNLTIQNTLGDGIRVKAGTLAVGAGVTVNNSTNDGINITGGVANIINPAGTQTLFSNNGQHGIEVSALGSVNVTGTPGSPVPSNSGTVVVYHNTQAGLRINQTPAGVGLVTNNINGLVSWANTNYGARLFGGSLIKVRNSVLLTNGADGVRVSGANVASGDDISQIDLGKAGDPGKNWLQSPLGVSPNSNTGLCVALADCNSAACRGGAPSINANLSAEGNEMVTTGNAQVDCSTATSIITKGACNTHNSEGVAAANNVVTTVDFAGCQ